MIIGPPISNFLFFFFSQTYKNLKQNTPQNPFAPHGVSLLLKSSVFIVTRHLRQQQKCDHATRAEQTQVPFLFSSHFYFMIL